MFQRLENIRNNLLDPLKMNDTLDKLIQEFPDLDIQKLRQLIRNHHKEVEKNTTDAHLFLIDENELLFLGDTKNLHLEF